MYKLYKRCYKYTVDIKANDGIVTRKKLKKMRKLLSEISTIHGIAHVFKKRAIAVRLIWILIICVSLSSCAYFVIYSFVDYFNYDVISKFDSFTSIPMSFPTITICNMNSYKNNKNYTLDQMLLSCRKGLDTCNSSDFVPVKISSYSCYSFNDGHNIEFTVSRKGFLYGLSLQLFPGFDNETKLYMNGFLLFVHNRTKFPLLEEALQVSSGQYTRIKVIFFLSNYI